MVASRRALEQKKTRPLDLVSITYYDLGYINSIGIDTLVLSHWSIISDCFNGFSCLHLSLSKKTFEWILPIAFCCLILDFMSDSFFVLGILTVNIWKSHNWTATKKTNILHTHVERSADQYSSYSKYRVKESNVCEEMILSVSRRTCNT